MSITILAEPTSAIADALYVALKAIDWGTCELVWKRVTVPELDKEQLNGNTVYVLIADESTTEATRDTRSSTSEIGTVDFGVRSRCDSDDLVRYAWLQGIAYTIGREILKLTNVSDACGSPRIIRTRVTKDVDRLRRGEFLTIRSAEFIVQGVF